MDVWTDEDEDLLQAYKARESVQRTGRFPPVSLPVSGYVKFPMISPIPLLAGENCLATAEVTFNTRVTVVDIPDNLTYRRITYDWRQDPLGAPFMKLFLAPINLLSHLFTLQRNTTTTNHLNVRRGFLIVTDRRLIQLPLGGNFDYIPWRRLSVDENRDPRGITVSWRDQEYGRISAVIEAPAWCRLTLATIIRYMARGNLGDLLVPDGFIDRARALGKL